MTDFLSLARTQRLVPVLRADDPAAAVTRVAELVAAGCRVIELTTTVPGWDRALGDAVERFGADGTLIGLGTVTTQEQATSAVRLGAAFLVSPYTAPAVRAVAADAHLPFLEGAFTPSELASAAAHGPVKLFPAHVGGPTYLKSVLTILPAGTAVIPTGGIGLADVDAYLRAGAVAVGVGSVLPTDRDALEELFAARFADADG
ncbi:MAG: aldolase [Streptosporangiales bacterium]|nr:aldolase [Streptosporangiales bacterium]